MVQIALLKNNSFSISSQEQVSFQYLHSVISDYVDIVECENDYIMDTISQHIHLDEQNTGETITIFESNTHVIQLCCSADTRLINGIASYLAACRDQPTGGPCALIKIDITSVKNVNISHMDIVMAMFDNLCHGGIRIYDNNTTEYFNYPMNTDFGIIVSKKDIIGFTLECYIHNSHSTKNSTVSNLFDQDICGDYIICGKINNKPINLTVQLFNQILLVSHEPDLSENEYIGVKDGIVMNPYTILDQRLKLI